MRHAVLLFPLLVFGLSSAAAQDDAGPRWTVEVYQIPDPQLRTGFASREQGQLEPPGVPGGDPTDEEIQEFLRGSTAFVTHYFELAGMPWPVGTVFAFDPETSTLAARLPELAQKAVAASAEQSLHDNAPHLLTFDLHLFEAPAADQRNVASEASLLVDHTAQLERMQMAAQAGEATALTTMHVETRSGQRVKLDRSQTVHAPLELSLAENGWLAFTTEEFGDGTVLELDPVVGPDSDTIDVNFSLTHSLAPVGGRDEPLAAVGEGVVGASFKDPATAKVSTATTMRSGTTKLIGVWTPAGAGGAEGEGATQQAGFLTGRTVAVLPRPDERLAQWIDAHGDAVAEIPPGEPQFERQDENIPPGMVVRRFRVPPTFMTGIVERSNRADAATDPFAAAGEPTFTVQATAKDILSAIGVQFPEGASANYLAATSELVIRNTPENIAIIEDYIEVPLQGFTVLAVTAHVIEADAAFLRRLAAENAAFADHGPAWDAVEMAVAQGDARVLRSAWLETRSGQRAKCEAGQLLSVPTGAEVNPVASADAKADEKAQAAAAATSADELMLDFIREQQLVGFSFEVDPVIGADGKTIDLNFAAAYDYAAPTRDRPRGLGADGTGILDPGLTTFHKVDASSAITLLGGTTRMTSVWKPGADAEPDVLQALFIRVDIVYSD